jgi:hypothetical protein
MSGTYVVNTETKLHGIILCTMITVLFTSVLFHVLFGIMLFFVI